MNKAIIIAGLTILLMSTQAQALCVSQPETAASQYVGSGVAQSLCLNNELGQTARRIDNNTQIDTLDSAVNQLQIQRRFDNMNNFNNLSTLNNLR
jgi:hypothetical protein